MKPLYRNTLVKTCIPKPGLAEFVRSSPIPRNGMGFACAYRVREKGGLFCCPVFDEFRGRNRAEARVIGL